MLRRGYPALFVGAKGHSGNSFKESPRHLNPQEVLMQTFTQGPRLQVIGSCEEGDCPADEGSALSAPAEDIQHGLKAFRTHQLARAGRLKCGLRAGGFGRSPIETGKELSPARVENRNGPVGLRVGVLDHRLQQVDSLDGASKGPGPALRRRQPHTDSGESAGPV